MGIPGPAQREAQPLPFLVFLVQPGRILPFHPEHIPMGLNIIGDLVDVDHSHNQLLNTGRHGNPVVQQVALGQQELTVYSTFQRHKAPRSMGRDRKGDNCHLLYALKGKDGLRTSFGAVRRLMLHFDAILEDMVDQSGEYDLVVPMPSGHAISRQFGQRLADRYRCPVQGGLFSKISKTRARELLEQSDLPSPDKRRVAKRLGKEDGDFSLKDIPTGYREHFPPITIRAELLPAGCTRFLLADDLLSTGTTLLAAQRQIQAAVPGAQVDAACLFSRV